MTERRESTASKHVLLVMHGYAPQDPHIVFEARSLKKAGFGVHVLGTARQVGRDVPTASTLDGAHVTIVPMVTRWAHLWFELGRWARGTLPATLYADGLARTNALSFIMLTLWLLRVGLRQPRLDVVHCRDVAPLLGAWLLAKLRRAKLVYDARENAPTMFSGRKGRMIAWLERVLLARTDAVISAGWRLEQAMLARGAKHVTHIGNWKHPQDYIFPAHTLQETRAALGIPASAVVVTFIGTLDPDREIVPLLDAVRTHPTTHAIIGGRGVLAQTVAQFAQECPNVHWLGWVNLADVPLYTALSDALYLCLDPQTFHEGDLQPAANKLFESLASGVPLIARTRGHEASDFLAREGLGILLEDVNTPNLHAVFERLHDRHAMAELRQRTLAVGRAYTWQEAEARLLALYASLVRNAS